MCKNYERCSNILFIFQKKFMKEERTNKPLIEKVLSMLRLFYFFLSYILHYLKNTKITSYIYDNFMSVCLFIERPNPINVMMLLSE